MKVKHLIVLPLLIMILLFTTLFGCAHNDNYGLSVKKWVGTREPYFIKGWGEPDKSYTKGQSKFLAYNENGGAPEGCTTTFEIVGEYVESFDYEGDGCVGDFYTHTRRR